MLIIHRYCTDNWCGLLIKKGSTPLSWGIRLKIAIGAARGLAYLHNLEKKIIYRDLKASSILVDKVGLYPCFTFLNEIKALCGLQYETLPVIFKHIP